MMVVFIDDVSLTVWSMSVGCLLSVSFTLLATHLLNRVCPSADRPGLFACLLAVLQARVVPEVVDCIGNGSVSIGIK
jgi:hypothetical protein